MHTIKWTESSLSFSTNVCRLCANISDVLVPVYAKEDDKERLDFKIKKCLPIVISKDDEKPKQICLNCVSKLNVCNDLVELCLAAEFKFESALQARISLRKESTDNDLMQCTPPLVIDQRATGLDKGIHLHTNGLDVPPLFTSQPTRVWDVGASLTQTPKCGENDVNDCSSHDQQLINSSQSIATTMETAKDPGNDSAGTGGTPAASLTVHTAHLSSDGVIVLGKAEGIRNTAVSHVSNSHVDNPLQTQSSAHQVTENDCQDILVMVELKYKDVLVAEHRVEATSSHHSGMSTFISDTSSNQQDIGTVSIEANASSIPSSANVNSTLVVPQATVVLDASRFKTHVAENIEEPEPIQTPEIISKSKTPPVQEIDQSDDQPLQQIQSDKPFSCDVCGKSFMRRTNLNAHMGIHTQVKPHSCDLCGKRFVVRWDLTLHKRIHSGLYSCEFCGKAFAVRGKLERHRRVHTGERPFSCDVCSKAFGDKRNLEAHRRCHTGEKPFACKVCGRSFRVNSHLSDHRRVHSQEKPFTCHVCGKSFKWKTNLNIHLKLHSGEHFTCEVCGRDFARKADLQKHYRGHTGDKPFPCDICDKRFGDRASLQKHLKCHSEEKPHTCEICGKSFLFIWYLNAHKKTHFEEKPYPCDHCAVASTSQYMDESDSSSASPRSYYDGSDSDGSDSFMGYEPEVEILESERNLRLLREEMIKENISAYIVTSSDDHQSEYVANHDKRREFISRFHGSSGEAVITLTKAALWTDSRYYLQAERELDSNWTLMRNEEPETPSMEDWLISELEQGDTVSTDPRIASFTEWDKWKTTLNNSGIDFVYEDSNLVDRIWDENQGRPPYWNEPIIYLGLEYAGVSWEDKVQTVRYTMENYGADAFIVTALDEIAWLFNLRGKDVEFTPVFRAYVIFGPDRDYMGNWSLPTLYLPESRLRARQEILDHLTTFDGRYVPIKDYEEFWEDLDTVGHMAHKVLLPTVFSYAKGASFAVYNMLPSSKVAFIPSPIAEFKSAKNPVEARGMRAAHIRDGVALVEFFYTIETGVRMGEYWDELKAVAVANDFRSKQNIWRGPSFESISAFGMNSALPHYVPTPETNLTIDTSSVFMFDSGGQYLDGTTDVTRTLYFGDPFMVTTEMKDIYTRLLMGCADLASVVFPEGTTMQNLDVLLRQNLFSAGLNYGHGSTHGIGSYLSVHEAFKYTYVANFFGSQEPGYYIQDKYGMRLENIVAVIAKDLSNVHRRFFGFETVTLVPYEPKLINANMMSNKQLRWLNDYHKQVQDTVGQELLNQGKYEVYAWLLEKTKPYEEVCGW